MTESPAPSVSLVTDWGVLDEDLPDLSPGEEFERVFRPQKAVVLLRIITRDVELETLQVGAVNKVPFDLVSATAGVSTYRTKDLYDADLHQRLVMTGASVATVSSIAVVPGLEIRAFVRNTGDTTVKPRVALLVEEAS